jgi:hypothetical protein
MQHRRATAFGRRLPSQLVRIHDACVFQECCYVVHMILFDFHFYYFFPYCGVISLQVPWLTLTHLMVGQDIAGAQDAYVYVVLSSESERRCHHCLTAQADLHRCSRCKKCWYCNATCQKRAWELWHKQECSVLSKNDKVTDSILLMARLLWKRKKEAASGTEGVDLWKTFKAIQRLKTRSYEHCDA